MIGGKSIVSYDFFAIMIVMNRLNITQKIQQNTDFHLWDITKIVFELSLPSILAQIVEIVMQYIDAAMVGSLGAAASASIGLVSSSTWLFFGLMMAITTGFSVQIAHHIGAGEYTHGQNVFRQGLIVCFIFSLLLGAIGSLISPYLPMWLGASPEIWEQASSYFLVFCLFMPARVLLSLSTNVLQSSGDTKTPSWINASMCLFDVFFNTLLIFPTRTVNVFGYSFTFWGANLGVTGAALGTAFAIVVCMLMMMYVACFKSPYTNLRQKGSWKLEERVMAKAKDISISIAMERIALSGAQILSTKIIAPLGTIAIAANSFAVTTEAICYMPGFGIGVAATTLVGQSYGAKKYSLVRKFAWVTSAIGMLTMSLIGAVVFFICPWIFAFLTPVIEVQQLGILVLRIELFAEAMFAASIVVSAALRGVGDTFYPALINLVSMWGVRLTLAFILSKSMGLVGVWIAMCIELNIRGILFLIRLKKEKWLKIPLEI